MKLGLFLLASLLIHISFVLVVPNYFAVTKLRIFPIELVEQKQLYLESFLKRIEGREGQKEKFIRQFLADEQRIREDFLISKLRELSLGESIDAPSASFLVPRKEEITPEERVRLLRSSPFFKDLSRLFREFSRSMSTYRGKMPSVGVGDTEISRGQILEDEGAQRIIAQMMIRAQSKEPRAQGVKKDTIGIKGPAGKRKIIYKPEIPEVKIDREGEVELKFWVLPNGSVGSVFPLMRADAELERVAINYIKQWRFSPLDQGRSPVEQWGTITIKFRLQ